MRGMLPLLLPLLCSYPLALVHIPLCSFVSPHTFVPPGARLHPPVLTCNPPPLTSCSFVPPHVPACAHLQSLLQLVLVLLLFPLPPLLLFFRHCCCSRCVYTCPLVHVCLPCGGSLWNSTCKIPVKTRLVFHRCNLYSPLHLSLKIPAKQNNCQLTYLCKCARTHGGGQSEGAHGLHTHNWFHHSVKIMIKMTLKKSFKTEKKIIDNIIT